MGLPRRYDPGGNPLNILSASMPAAATALEAARDETTARNELPGHVVEVNAVPMVTAVLLWPSRLNEGLSTVAAE